MSLLKKRFIQQAILKWGENSFGCIFNQNCQPQCFTEQGSKEFYEERKISPAPFTASGAASVIGHGFDSRKVYYKQQVQRIKKEVSEFTQQCYDYGNKHERDGKLAYMQVMGFHKFKPVNVTLYQCGTFFNLKENDLPFSGSPDGVLFYFDEYPILIEIKCPYIGDIPEEVPIKYLAQILFMMHILELECTHFVYWKPDRLVVFEIKYSSETYNKIKPYFQEWCDEAGKLTEEQISKMRVKNGVKEDTANAFSLMQQKIIKDVKLQ